MLLIIIQKFKKSSVLILLTYVILSFIYNIQYNHNIIDKNNNIDSYRKYRKISLHTFFNINLEF